MAAPEVLHDLRNLRATPNRIRAIATPGGHERAIDAAKTAYQKRTAAHASFGRFHVAAWTA